MGRRPLGWLKLSKHDSEKIQTSILTTKQAKKTDLKDALKHVNSLWGTAAKENVEVCSTSSGKVHDTAGKTLVSEPSKLALGRRASHAEDLVKLVSLMRRENVTESKIMITSSMAVSQGKSGLPVKHSANTHPKLQTSRPE